MNQKRITNQILKQTNYTLNSTLNYLFNISNMKKLFSYLLISSMVVLSSCTNYDDQFDDLNSQINSLKSQIEGFSSLSSGLTALQGTVSSLQSAVASLPQTATPATDISGLEAAVAELQAALSGAATSAEVAALTADLAATQAALDASIAANATATAAAQTALEAALATAQASNTTATDALAATLADLEAELATAATAAEVAEISTAIAANQAALVLAIGENATASANNSDDIADLAASLEALTATITELQATLATVSTAEEVADLAAALEAAQADLTAIIASSSFYDGDLDITTQDELNFATSLGDKIKFIKGDLTIDQDNDEDMDAVQLTAVMAKVLNVTGDLSYTSTETATAKGAFTSLTGAGSVTIDQSGNISLPKLINLASGTTPVTVANLAITGSSETEVVSLPALKSVEGSMTFTDLGSVTSFSMPVMVAHDGSITIEIDNAGTVDLSAFTNATSQDGTALNATTDVLTVNASELIAPVYKLGPIVANRLVDVDLPMWQYAASSSFDRAQTVVLPSVTPTYASTGTVGYTININGVFDDAKSVHIIAAASTKATSPVHISVSSTSTALETLILGGTFNGVDISGEDVTSITFDGTAKTVRVDNTDIETLDLPYTTAASGSFTVTNNSKLLSLSADKIDGLATFNVSTNADLAEISFDALEVSSATGADIDVSGNDLSIEAIYDEVDDVSDLKIESADLAVLKSFMADAITKVTSAATSSVNVDVDLADIVRAYDDEGEERDPVSGDTTIAAYSYMALSTGGVTGVAESFEIYFSALAADQTVTVEDENVSIITNTGLDAYYDIKAWADSEVTASQLAADGIDLTIESYGKGQRTAQITWDDIAGYSSTVLEVGSGRGATVSVTAVAASTADQINDAIISAFASNSGVVSKYFTVGTATGDKLVFTSNAKGSDRETFALVANAYELSTAVEGTSIAFTGSRTIENNLDAVTSAWVRFASVNDGAEGERTITFTTGANATKLNISGVDTTDGIVGDDEFYTASVTDVTATAVTDTRTNKIASIQ